MTELGSEAQLRLSSLLCVFGSGNIEPGSDKGVLLCSHLRHLEMKRLRQITAILN